VNDLAASVCLGLDLSTVVAGDHAAGVEVFGVPTKRQRERAGIAARWVVLRCDSRTIATDT
jgi:hypothetical protein